MIGVGSVRHCPAVVTPTRDLALDMPAIAPVVPTRCPTETVADTGVGEQDSIAGRLTLERLVDSLLDVSLIGQGVEVEPLWPDGDQRDACLPFGLVPDQIGRKAAENDDGGRIGTMGRKDGRVPVDVR